MAAYSAARSAVDAGMDIQVTVLEKMPRPGRKIMITGKGRCNFTNVKPWNEFSGHIRSKSNFIKSAFYSLPPEKVVDFFEKFGCGTVVERGDRAFPVSYHASDIVDTLVNACLSVGVKIETEFEVAEIHTGQPSSKTAESRSANRSSVPAGSQSNGFDIAGRDEGGQKTAGAFEILSADGRKYLCQRLIIATGGLSYPGTGSTGDGYGWAREMGHSIVPTFPSLTALVPKGYKDPEGIISEFKFHIDRSSPRTEFGDKLCGIQLKNVGAALFVEGTEAGNEFGDIDFTDGGIEGPIGFQLSRKAVKSLVNGSKVALSIDLKPGVGLTEVTERVKALWSEIDKDPRSRRLREKERCRVLLGKLMPWELIPAFTAANPGIITLERRGRADTKVWVNLVTIAKALKDWRFEIAGFVGYERAVVTAGGVSTDELIAKTMESRIVEGLYFCGEVLDVDADTGGYNLQAAFATGSLAGTNAAKSLNQ